MTEIFTPLLKTAWDLVYVWRRGWCPYWVSWLQIDWTPFVFLGEQIIWRHSSYPIYHCSNKQVSENVLSFFRITCYWAAYLAWWHIFFTISYVKWTILYILLSGHQLSLSYLRGNNKVMPISERTFYFSLDRIESVLVCMHSYASHDKINVFLKGGV